MIRLAITAAPDFWAYLASSLPAGAVLNAVGVGAFVVAILSDRLLTRGSHLRRVQDLKDAHALEVTGLKQHYDELTAQKDAAYAELKESRNGYKEATQIERARADKATEALADIAGLLEVNVHLLKSLDEAVKDPKP